MSEERTYPGGARADGGGDRADGDGGGDGNRESDEEYADNFLAEARATVDRINASRMRRAAPNAERPSATRY